METGLSPTPDDIDLVHAFETYNEIQANITSVREITEVKTDIVKVERDGLLGKILDYLISEKKVPKVRTVNKFSISYMELQLVQLIESVKNDVRQKKIEEAQNNASGY